MARAAIKRVEKGALEYAPDPEEEAALNDAASALARTFPGVTSPRSLAAVAISGWIISRTRQVGKRRLADNVVFDFENAQLLGLVEAALPYIGEALADLPPDTPLFELSKDDVVRVFAAGILGVRAANESLKESQNFPFDDEVPF